MSRSSLLTLVLTLSLATCGCGEGKDTKPKKKTIAQKRAEYEANKKLSKTERAKKMKKALKAERASRKVKKRESDVLRRARFYQTQCYSHQWVLQQAIIKSGEKPAAGPIDKKLIAKLKKAGHLHPDFRDPGQNRQSAVHFFILPGDEVKVTCTQHGFYKLPEGTQRNTPAKTQAQKAGLSEEHSKHFSEKSPHELFGYRPTWRQCWVMKLDGQGQKLWRTIVDEDKNAMRAASARGNGAVVLTHGREAGRKGCENIVTALGDGGVVLWRQSLPAAGLIPGGDIVVTKEGGAILVGASRVAPGKPTKPFICHFDSQGKELWRKEMTSQEWATIQMVKQTQTGEIIIAGEKKRKDEKRAQWVAALSLQDGSLLWEVFLTQCFHAKFIDMEVAPDGTIYLLGSDKPAKRSQPDLLLLALKDKKILWQNTVGGRRRDLPGGLALSSAGLLATGSSMVTQSGFTSSNFWLGHYSTEGSLNKHYTFGGNKYDEAADCVVLADGNFVVVGNTQSFGMGQKDLWAVKVTPDGSVLWQRSFGGENDEMAHTVEATEDGGLVIGGSSIYMWMSAEENATAKCEGPTFVVPMRTEESTATKTTQTWKTEPGGLVAK